MTQPALLVASRRVHTSLEAGAGDPTRKGTVGTSDERSAALLIRGGIIERVESLSTDESWAAGLRSLTNLLEADTGQQLEVLDLGQRWLTPAFVNPHTHLALGFLRGRNRSRHAAARLVEDFYYPFESRLTADDVRAFTRLGAYESLLAGVGLVWDHYYFATAVAEAVFETGLSAVVAPTLQDRSGPGAARGEVALAETEALANGGWSERGVFAALGPHASDTASLALWKSAAEVARRLRLPLHAHLAQSLGEWQQAVARHGTTPLDLLLNEGVFEGLPSTLLVHLLFTTDHEIQRLDQERDHPVWCPSAQMVFGFPADPTRFERLGLSWMIATDTSVGNDSMNLQKELRLAAGLRTAGTAWSAEYHDFIGTVDGDTRHGRRAVDLARRRQHFFEAATDLARPSNLLDRVWSHPGALHPHFTAGVIAPGALANLAIWDTRHPSFWPAESPDERLAVLAMGDTTGALDGLITNGRLVGKIGDFQRSLLSSDAYSAAQDEGRRRLVELIERAALPPA